MKRATVTWACIKCGHRTEQSASVKEVWHNCQGTKSARCEPVEPETQDVD